MKYLVIFAIVLSSTFASAAVREVEHFYQAGEDQWVNRIGLEWAQQTTQAQGGSEFETSVFKTRFGFEKGFFNWLSVGANFRYSFSSVRSEAADIYQKGAGLDNPEFFVRTRFKFGMFDLRAGFDYSYSYENVKIASDGRQTNAGTGRDSILPYLGLNLDFNKIQTGFRVTQEVALSDISSQAPNDVVTRTSGQELTRIDLYGELHMEEWAIGASLSSFETSDSDTNGVKSENLGFLRLNVYAPFYINDNLTLRPEIYYDQNQTDSLNGTNIDKFDSYGVNALARFTF